MLQAPRSLGLRLSDLQFSPFGSVFFLSQFLVSTSLASHVLTPPRAFFPAVLRHLVAVTALTTVPWAAASPALLILLPHQLCTGLAALPLPWLQSHRLLSG